MMVLIARASFAVLTVRQSCRARQGWHARPALLSSLVPAIAAQTLQAYLITFLPPFSPFREAKQCMKIPRGGGSGAAACGEA